LLIAPPLVRLNAARPLLMLESRHKIRRPDKSSHGPGLKYRGGLKTAKPASVWNAPSAMPLCRPLYGHCPTASAAPVAHFTVDCSPRIGVNRKNKHNALSGLPMATK
jgi:hypothetical protein